MREKIAAWLEKHEFIKNLLQLMSGSATAQLVPILASPLVARLYSPAELGVFTAISALTATVFTVSTGRYDMAIVAPTDEREARGLVTISRKLSGFTCSLLGLLLVCLSGQVSQLLNIPQLRLELAAVGFIAWSMAQVQILSHWCIRRKEFGAVGSTRMIQSGGTAGVQIGLGFLSWGIHGLIASLLFGHSLAALRIWRRSRMSLASAPRMPIKRVLALHKKMPLVNLPNAMLDSIRVNGTQLLIQAMFSSAALGQFGQAWRLLQAPAALINSSLSQVFYQKLSVTSQGKMRATVIRSILVSALIGLLPFAAIYLLAPVFFPIVFGERWATAGIIGAALTPWMYMNFISSPISFLFIVVRRQGVLLLYAFPLTAAPLLVIAKWHQDIVETVSYMSLTMSAMLAIVLLLAVKVAKDYDGDAAPAAA